MALTPHGVDIPGLIRRYGLISDQVDAAELTVLLTELAGLTISGAVVEFGCYRGTSSLYLRRIIDQTVPREFHVYDSFAGLPEKTPKDMSPAGLQFVAGELSAAKKEFLAEFKRAGLRSPVAHKAWFDDLTDEDVPNDIAFAFLDGDYYESIKTPLRLIEAKLVPGAVVIVDDYANEALPGAAKAVDEWAGRRGLRVRQRSSLAIITL